MLSQFWSICLPILAKEMPEFSDKIKAGEFLLKDPIIQAHILKDVNSENSKLLSSFVQNLPKTNPPDVEFPCPSFSCFFGIPCLIPSRGFPCFFE